MALDNWVKTPGGLKTVWDIVVGNMARAGSRVGPNLH